MSSQAAAKQLHGQVGGSMLNVRGTDLYGVVLSAVSASGAKAVAEQIGLNHNVQTVMVPLETGQVMLGYTYEPRRAKPVLKAQGRQMQLIGGAAGYGQRPLYGGAWTCVGDQCLKERP